MVPHSSTHHTLLVKGLIGVTDGPHIHLQSLGGQLARRHRERECLSKDGPLCVAVQVGAAGEGGRAGWEKLHLDAPVGRKVQSLISVHEACDFWEELKTNTPSGL